MIYSSWTPDNFWLRTSRSVPGSPNSVCNFIYLSRWFFITCHFKKCGVLCYTLLSKNCIRVFIRLSVCLSICMSVSASFSPSTVSTLNQFSSNLLWELILGRSVLGLQMGKFWQINTELRPLIDVRIWFSLSIIGGIPLPIFFKLGMIQTWYESQYCEGVFWDCRWVNFDK